MFRKKAVELPGFFRPTKEWDLLVVRDGTLLVAIEAKSQVGPSFGNNFNNRTEEAMGSALDLWTAYRERAYLKSPQPFLGYFFMLEDCEASNRPVKLQEPQFKVFPEFVGGISSDTTRILTNSAISRTMRSSSSSWRRSGGTSTGSLCRVAVLCVLSGMSAWQGVILDVTWFFHCTQTFA